MANLQAFNTFTHVRSEEIASLNVTVSEYIHNKTKAKHFHIDAESKENVFLVALKTIPTDSTGVAHMLEHTVLCGSEKYPVRDPFFMMIRRSLNTFMNAFTSSDWTAYPFASENKKDFNNLLNVYLDATFFSRIDPLDFAQEGHRFELAGDKVDGELSYKGVVFNEMKGAMSSSNSVAWQTLTKYIFPTTTYHFNSGGEPDCIPDLSYEELVDFYKKHYHPSNAIFFTFGDIPAAEHQKVFEEQALHRFDYAPVTFPSLNEKRYHAPIRVTEQYSESTEVDKTMHTVGWLLGESTDLESQLEAHLLSNVLLDNSASPLRNYLETTEIAQSPSGLCGLEDSNYQMCFMCGVEGSNVGDVDKFEADVLAILSDVAENGVDYELLESVLHQLELFQREISGDSYPYGMQLIMASMSGAIHGGDPIALLNLDPVIESLREKIKDPEFIKSLAKRLLVDNQHRVTLTLKPNKQLNEMKELAEKARLAEVEQALTLEAREEIVAQQVALRERQNQQDDPSILPKVGLEDIPPQVTMDAPDLAEATDGVGYYFYDKGTNGLIYYQYVMPLPALTADEAKLLGVLTSVITEVGLGDRDYLAVQKQQSAYTGGIGAYVTFRDQVKRPGEPEGYLVLSGKALQRNASAMLGLLKEVITSVRFDEYDRIKDLVGQIKTRKDHAIVNNGHSYAMMQAASTLSPIAALSQSLYGTDAIFTIKAFHEECQQSPETFVAKLQSLFAKLTAQPVTLLAVADDQFKVEAMKIAKTTSAELKSGESSVFTFESMTSKKEVAVVTHSQINYCAQVYPTVSIAHPDSAGLNVLATYMKNNFLHKAIREQGGAYGGGASADINNNCFKFYSYRDPRLTETFSDFDACIAWLASAELTDDKLEEAILGVIGALDKPGSPAGQAKTSFYHDLFGRDKALRQQFRENVLNTTCDDLKRLAQTYLVKDKAVRAVVTSAEAVDECRSQGFEILEVA